MLVGCPTAKAALECVAKGDVAVVEAEWRSKQFSTFTTSIMFKVDHAR